jgi:transposase
LEFKQDAAQLVLEKGYSHQQAAEHLGISLSALGRWVRAERKPLSPDSVTRKVAINLADYDELVRLRKENEQLRMEREILKKAAVFFAKEAE